MSGKVKDYGAIRSLEELQALTDRLLETDDPIGFDIETGYNGNESEKRSLRPHEGAFVVGFSLSVDPNAARYVPLRHGLGGRDPANLDPDEAMAIVKPLLEQPRIVSHHAKFEQKFMRTEGIELGIVADSMLQAFVLSEWPSVGLKDVTEALFGHVQPEIESLYEAQGIKLSKKQAKALRFNVLQVTPEVIEYACEDALWCLAIDRKLRARAEQERGFVYRLEMQISDIMSWVEQWGVAVDWSGIEQAKMRAEPFIEKFEAELKSDLGALAGRSLAAMNLNSAKQLRELLYDEIGMPVTKQTNGGAPSTDAVAMERLAVEYPAIRKLLELREIGNLARRFDKWLGYRHTVDDRVHASYSQVTVGTGRFAASDPPIQQCPKDWRWELREGKTFEGNFRDFLTVDDGWYMLGFDYSQIELRVLAGLSGEPMLINAFKNGDDVHSLTAAMMLGKRVEDVDKKTDRPIGKTMNFALLYQMGPKSLADRLALSHERAKELYDMYFAQFARIATWIERAKIEGKQRGSTLSWIGRKYTVWELQSSSTKMYAKGERVLVNAPVQGGAADYVKIAMVRVRNELVERGWWGSHVKMTMNQHDQLMFEVSQELDPREVREALLPSVEFPVDMFPVMRTDWEFGYRWGSLVEIDADTAFTRDDQGRWQIAEGGQTDPEEDQAEDLEVLLGQAVPCWKCGGTGTDFGQDCYQCAGTGHPVKAHPDLVRPRRSDADDDAVEDQPDEVIETGEGRTDTASGVAGVGEVCNDGGDLTEQGDGRVVIIELTRPPTRDEFSRLLALLNDTPGGHSVRVRAEGGEFSLPGTTGVSPIDGGRIAMAVTGARVTWAPESVDSDSLAMGLTL